MRITPRPVHPTNWRRGREWDGPLDQVVIHVTEGSAASTRSWFAARHPAGRESSAHYCVNKDGTVDQFVDEKDTAYAQGVVDRPTAPLVLLRPGVNPNAYSISIEHEGSGKEDLTPDQRASSIELLRDVCTRQKIPMTRRHIVAHRQIRASKSCPGAIDVDRLVRELAVDRRAPDPSPTAEAPLVVWSDYFKDWLLVTSVVGDADWWFIPLNEIRGNIAPRRSTQLLSKMPRKMV